MEMLSLTKNNLSEGELKTLNHPKYLGKILNEGYGLKEDDRIRFMSLEYSGRDNWEKAHLSNDSLTIKDFLDKFQPMLSDKTIVKNCFEKGIYAFDFYIGHCTHDGSSTYKKENCLEITCLIIDIDFGSDGHKKVTFETESEALRHIEQNLPDCTMILHTGGGYQIIYKLSSRIPLKGNIERIEKISRGLTRLGMGDFCHTVEHVFRLPMSYNNKIRFKPRTVRIIKYNPDCTYTPDELENILSEKGVDFSKVALKESKSTPAPSPRREKHLGIDRSSYAYYLICEMVSAKKNEQEIVRAINKTCLKDHYRNDDYLRQDIRNITKGMSKMMPKPKNQIMPLDSGTFQLSPEIEIKLREFNAKLHKTTANTECTIKVLEWLIEQKHNAILALPCGVGKTTGAMVLTSAIANPSNRIMIVTKKVEDVIEIVRILKMLGIKAIPWHGFNDNLCHLGIKYSELKNKKYNPCVTCPNKCSASNKRLSENKYDSPEYDVIVTTHAHYRFTRMGGKLNPFKLIIIDEAPSEFEFFQLNNGRISALNELFKDNAIFQHQINRFIKELNSMLKNGDCRNISTLAMNTISKVKSFMFDHLNKMYQEKDIDDSQLDLALEFLNYLGDGSKIYSMMLRDSKGERYCFAKGNIEIDVPVQHIILDGSAKLSDMHWKGFNIYVDNSIRLEYPNTILHILKHPPTKQSLLNTNIINDLKRKIKDVLSGKQNPKILFMSNKEPQGDLKDNIDSLRSSFNGIGETIELPRGKHVGSNDGKDCDVTIIAMSLFSNVEFYTLKAALVSDSEISSNRIWKKPFIMPNYQKGGGFADLEINQAYIRCLAYDLYQALMRGKIRTDSNSNYEAIIIMSSLEVVSFVSEDLKGAIIDYDQSEIVEMIKSGKSQSEINKKLQDGKTSPSTIADQVRCSLNDFLLKV